MSPFASGSREFSERANDSGYVRSADGTNLHFYVFGDGPLTWIAPPAMGAPIRAMERIYEGASAFMRVITWDMRGFHRSSAPSDDAYDVPSNADDLEAVRSALGVERFLLGGWSMGVPTSLEYASRSPERVLGLCLLNGPFHDALRHAVPLPFGDAILRWSIDRFGPSVGRVSNAWSERILGRTGVGRVLHRAGVISQEPEHFEYILREFSKIDWVRYFRVIRRLGDYTAASILPDLTMPSLIVTGTDDAMIPLETAFRMARNLPRAELFVVQGGTHYTPAEFSPVVVRRMRRFVEMHGLDRA